MLIDGGFLRIATRRAQKLYDPAFIQQVAHACVAGDEDCLRILYYDCAPFRGTALLPVSGVEKSFTGSDRWLHEIAAPDLFAVRRGVLKFRGFERKKNVPNRPLTDDDFKPQFEQKGVDMRIGLDIAAYATERLVDRVILITNDTDCVPAVKFCTQGWIAGGVDPGAKLQTNSRTHGTF